MSIVDQCKHYSSTTSNISWKHRLGNIIEALKREAHPDHEIFSNVACILMMHNQPGYGCWLNRTIAKLIDDPKARLDLPPDLPDYGDMTDADLVEKYELNNDENYPRDEILIELKCRYPSLILTENSNLRSILQ